MQYIFQSASILLMILSISKFLSNNFSIEKNIRHVFSILILIILSFLSLKLINFVNVTYKINLDYKYIFKFLFLVVLAGSLLNLFYKKNKLNNIDMFFIIIYIIICFFNFDRYFLDEDEFSFWGQKLKDFYFFNENNHLKFDYYHQPLLTSWQLFFISTSYFNENSSVLIIPSLLFT